MCKAGLLGQVSTQRDLYRVFKKKIPQELHVRGWQVTEEMPGPEFSSSADDAWDSGCHLRAQTERGFIMRMSPCLSEALFCLL